MNKGNHFKVSINRDYFVLIFKQRITYVHVSALTVQGHGNMLEFVFNKYPIDTFSYF